MRLWRMVLVVGLVTLLAGCGRETSVQLSDGAAAESSGQRSMTGDPNDTLGGMEPGEATAPMSPPDPGERTEGPGHVPAQPAQETPQGIAAGEPNPGNPDGCPECTASTEAPHPDPEPTRSPSGGYTTPRSGQEDVRARSWDSAEVAEDGVTVTITWWSGVEPCSVLDRVEVDEGADKVVITLYEGNAPGDEGACPAIAVEKRTQVRLTAPVADRPIMDGARGR